MEYAYEKSSYIMKSQLQHRFQRKWMSLCNQPWSGRRPCLTPQIALTVVVQRTLQIEWSDEWHWSVPEVVWVRNEKEGPAWPLPEREEYYVVNGRKSTLEQWNWRKKAAYDRKQGLSWLLPDQEESINIIPFCRIQWSAAHDVYEREEFHTRAIGLRKAS